MQLGNTQRVTRREGEIPECVGKEEAKTTEAMHWTQGHLLLCAKTIATAGIQHNIYVTLSYVTTHETVRMWETLFGPPLLHIIGSHTHFCLNGLFFSAWTNSMCTKAFPDGDMAISHDICHENGMKIEDHDCLSSCRLKRWSNARATKRAWFLSEKRTGEMMSYFSFQQRILAVKWVNPQFTKIMETLARFYNDALMMNTDLLLV